MRAGLGEDRDPEDALLRVAALLMEAREGEQLEAAVRLAQLAPHAHGLANSSEAQRLRELRLPGEGQWRVDPDEYSRRSEEVREEAVELLRDLAAKQARPSPVEQLRSIRSRLVGLTQGSAVHGEILQAIGVLQDELDGEDSSVQGLSSLTLPNERLSRYGPEKYSQHLQRTISTATRVIDGAIERLDTRARETSHESDLDASISIYQSTVDPDLWVYIGTLVTNGDWQHVASAACRFLEHQLREFAGVGSEIGGPTLVAQLFGSGAPLALGDNEGQRQGWEQLVRGLLMGPRNAVQHGIDSRPSTDLRRFSSGIVGTVTLVLAELRARHPQQFVQPDVGPEADI